MNNLALRSYLRFEFLRIVQIGSDGNPSQRAYLLHLLGGLGSEW